MLSISGAIIYVCSYTSTSLKLRYPSTNCVDTDEMFADDADGYESDAFKEYILNEQLKEKGELTMYTTVMQCFCRSKGEEEKNKEYTITVTDDNGESKEEKKKFCAEYYKDKTLSKGLGTSISFIIIAINVALKTIIIKLIESIKQDTYSERLASITNGVFIAQFFNTGFLLLLVNANVTEHSPMWLT